MPESINDVDQPTHSNYFSIFVLVIASAFFLYDIIVDVLEQKDNFGHIVLEGLVFLCISYVLYVEIRRAYRLHVQVGIEKEKVSILSGELFRVITEQFKKWELSNSEFDIALMLIKGLSMKEIAELRGVKEKTIRQQSANIYSKTGLSGRHELASFFIEDLLKTSGNEGE